MSISRVLGVNVSSYENSLERQNNKNLSIPTPNKSAVDSFSIS